MVVKLDENVKNLFAAMRSMAGKTIAGKPISRAQKAELRAEVYRLIELVPANSQNRKGETLLIRAIYDGDVDLVRHLAQKCVNCSGLEKPDITLLLAASEKDYIKIMLILFDAGADPSASPLRWDQQHNMLCHAICDSDIEAVKLLLTSVVGTYDLPLHSIAADNNAVMLLFLLEHGVGDVSAVDDEGRSALQYAIDNNALGENITAVLAALLDHGAAIDHRSDNGTTALHCAIEQNDMPAALLLLDRGANATIANDNGQMAVHYWACRTDSRAEVLTALLTHGASVDTMNGRGKTPLHCAANRRYYYHGLVQDASASLAALLDHGAAIDHRTRDDGKTALHYAVADGDTPAALFLIGRGANVALVDVRGETALHNACSAEVVTALLAHGALVNAVDRNGKTPLHFVTRRNFMVTVPAATALLEAGANVNATDANGDTPLHIWARSSSYQSQKHAAQLLINHNADLAARNNANQCPSDVAQTGKSRTFLLAEETRKNNHRYKRPRLEDLQPPAAIAVGAEAAAGAEQEEEEEEDESEDDSEDEEEEGEDD